MVFTRWTEGGGGGTDPGLDQLMNLDLKHTETSQWKVRCCCFLCRPSWPVFPQGIGVWVSIREFVRGIMFGNNWGIISLEKIIKFQNQLPNTLAFKLSQLIIRQPIKKSLDPHLFKVWINHNGLNYCNNMAPPHICQNEMRRRSLKLSARLAGVNWVSAPPHG